MISDHFGVTLWMGIGVGYLRVLPPPINPFEEVQTRKQKVMNANTTSL